MTTWIRRVGLVLLLGALLTPAATAREMPIPEEVTTLASGNTAFALDLYRALARFPHSLEGDGNLFFSPHSISEAMAMAHAGARGETAAALGRGLRFGLPHEKVPAAFRELRSVLKRMPDRSYGHADPLKLHVANAFWADKHYPFRAAYRRLLLTHFDAAAHTADFQEDAQGAIREINGWVNRSTNEKIPELLGADSLGPDTTLVLVNAIYFKAVWRHPFQENGTRPRPFTKLDGTAVEVPTMHLTESFWYAKGDDWEIVELPYARSNAAMTIILPAPGALAALEKRLDAKTLESMLATRRYRGVALALPRMKARSKFELTDVLAKLGMGIAFSGEADFSGMTDAGRLFISKVIHEAMLDVDENGTEAAAATAVVMDKGGESRPVPVRVDRPFLVLIRNTKTNAILFCGRITNPAPGA